MNAAPTATFFQRLHRFLRPDSSARFQMSDVGGSDTAAVSAAPTVDSMPLSAQRGNPPEPAHIALFEITGTPASPIFRWATTSEPATACFNLERSTDGVQWRSIHLTAATGDAHRGATYCVPVQAAREGRQIFRVRQTLLDGTALLSDVLELEPVANAPARVSILPGRVTDFLQLRLADPQPASITLRDARNTAVTGTVVHGTTARIDLGGVAVGVYFLHFSQAGMEEILRFEKE